ncbi:MAG: DNA-protecting protein DprA [Candidatus Stahlbacteria bacterium]|nr:MAG: DNA-protecting protein DprA [Candidatus Stahlbacteria bacterium]
MKNEAYVDLLSVEGLGQTRIARLMEILGSAEEILARSKAELTQAGVPQKIAARIASYSRSKETADDLKCLERCGARIVTSLDENYPLLLKSSPQPPAVLFVRGELRAEEKLVVAMVGTRTPTGYGRAAAERLARELGARGVVIVSGAARGIDSLAHKGCLSAGGRTIAVLGCGIDISYPPENAELFDRIAAQGAVITEFLPGVIPAPGLFPRRNRIIAWLSHGVVAVEAGPRSGALITARWAADAGRDVFAVPGGIFSEQSAGTNRLLRDGAKLVSRVEDILEEYAAVYQPVSVEGTQDMPDDSALSDEEKRIYRLLGPEPIHVDNLVDRLGIPSAQLLPTLLGMELKGVIKQLPGMRFVRVL